MLIFSQHFGRKNLSLWENSISKHTVELCEQIFFSLYTGGEIESEPTVDLSSEYTSRIQKEMENVERPIPPSMDSSSMARLSQTQYLASVVKVCLLLTFPEYV